MNIISLFSAVVYTVVVLGTCGFLLARGFTHAFIFWFAAGTALQTVPRIGFYVLEQMPGGIGANARWVPAFSAVAMLGTAFFVVGFVTLAAFLVRTKPPEA